MGDFKNAIAKERVSISAFTKGADFFYPRKVKETLVSHTWAQGLDQVFSLFIIQKAYWVDVSLSFNIWRCVLFFLPNTFESLVVY